MHAPEWFQDELRRIGALVVYEPYPERELIMPPVGQAFYRVQRRGQVFYKYAGPHPTRGQEEFVPPSAHVTPGRFVIRQTIGGDTTRTEKVFDLVEETGELLPCDTRTLVFLAQRRDRWETIEQEIEAAEAAEKKAADDAFVEALTPAYEELVYSRSRSQTVRLNDATQAKKGQTEIVVTDKRRFNFDLAEAIATTEYIPEPPEDAKRVLGQAVGVAFGEDVDGSGR